MITVGYMSITFGQMRTLLTIGNGFEDHNSTSFSYTTDSININLRVLFKNCNSVETVSFIPYSILFLV